MIDFNFGEHFHEAGNSSFLYDIGITFLSAFFGFLAALLVNKQIDKKKNKRDNEDKRQQDMSHLKYLSHLLSSILVSYRKQAENYRKLSDKVNKNPIGLFEPELQATYDLERLKNMDCKELRDVYFRIYPKKEKSIDNYKNLFAYVDYLLLYFNDLKQQNVNHRNFTHKDLLFVRDCIEEVANRLGLKEKNIQKYNPNNYTDIREYKYLHSLSKVYLELSNTSDIGSFRDNYLVPIHNSILEEIEDTTFADSVFNTLKKGINRIRNIEFNSIEFAKDMINVEKNTEESFRILEDINNELIEITNHNKV